MPEGRSLSGFFSACGLPCVLTERQVGISRYMGERMMATI